VLETAIVTYRRKDAIEASLIAAVHVGDKAYYEKLQKKFETYDALLYEMIKDRDADVSSRVESDSILSMFQRGMKNVLELEFQLDAIDYSRANFVHADMDPETFFGLMEKKGESLISIMLQAMLEQWKRELEGKGSQLNGFQILAAFTSPDRARSLKLLLAKEFGRIEEMMAGFDRGADGKGSVLLSGRNEVAIDVLRKEIRKGRKKLAIFYGAGHMPDLEKRLRALGFHKTSQKWLVAWDLRQTRAKEPDGSAKPSSEPAEKAKSESDHPAEHPPPEEPGESTEEPVRRSADRP
jgi:hypothetical protein